jgi:hypothetical protein
MAEKKPFDLGMATGLTAANGRVAKALETSRQLLDAGFPSAAFVWAVRAVEMFVREFLMAPAYFDGGGYAEWMRAMKKARKAFGRNNWRKARAVVEKEWGPIAPLLTESGDDVWQDWVDSAVLARHDVVHGNGEVTTEEVRAALEYAEALIPALRRQMLDTDKHPAGDLFLTQLKAALKASPSAGAST